MSLRNLVRLFACLWFPATLLVANAQGTPAIFPDEDPQTPADYRLVWPATPGYRYEIRQSTDLKAWTVAPGFPATADGPAQQLPFTAGNTPLFFQVVPLDDQPPAIANQFPADGGFAVRRTAVLTVELTDATGVDPASLQLTVGNLGPVALGDSRLTFTNGVLTFAAGDSTPLGTFGATVPATLIATDALGNRGTNTWSFTLELEPQVVANLFVFGSPRAQASGQRLGDIPTAALARRLGPVRQNAGVPWTLESVQPDRLVLAYTQTTPPAFAAGTYVCNLTPATTGEIFYRKINSVSDDAAGKRLTLLTVDVPLEEMIEEGSVAISGESVILETTPNGRIARAFEIDGSVTFPRIGWSLDGSEFKLKDSQTDFDLVKFTTEELHWWLTPQLQAGLEIKSWRLKRFEAIASGKIDFASVAQVDFLLAGEVPLEKTLFDLPEAAEPKHSLLLGFIGIPPFAVPVYATLGFDVKLKARAEAKANLSFRWGLRQEVDSAFGVAYTAPNVRWVHEFPFAELEVVPFTAVINVEGSFKLSLEPELEFLVYGLAGVSAGITPSAGVVIEAGTTTPLSGRLEADVDLDLALAGPAFDWINPQPELSLNLWHDQLHLFPKPAALTFNTQPASLTADAGGSASFVCSVSAASTPSYQWFHNGIPLPGQRFRTLFLPLVNDGHAGQYHVRVTAGGTDAESEKATLTVRPRPSSVPSGMALIPAGSFQMGDTLNEGDVGERPVHPVFVSTFYMDKYEVTKALWDEVYTWAVAHGYRFANPALGKAANHPVYNINWYDTVKWCNARSEKEGFTPCYYTDAGQSAVYRNGNVDLANNAVKWTANGYRLPTEAEWEKAARGGLQGKRFPWGDTITHSRATYDSGSRYAYDVSPTRGYHPEYAVGGIPYTSPVGSFAANGYGLFDMAGNVWEWCWDGYGPYPSGSQTDPRGPASVSDRVLRGGYWGVSASYLRCAFRGYVSPSFYDLNAAYVGFRCMRGL